MTNIFLIGIRRSGNHAIANWLYPMIDNVMHLNCIFLRDLTTSNYDKWITNKKCIKNFSACKWIPFNEDHNLLISLEEQDLKEASTRIKDLINHSGRSNSKIILLMRSPKNLLASNWKYFNKNQKQTLKQKGIWKEYAKEFLGITSYFEDKVCVYYDKWFTDEEYRKKICEDIGLTFNDTNFTKVFGYGKSSFDGYKFKNDATKMDVLNRYKVFENDPIFMNIIDDKEIDELADKIRVYDPFVNSD